MISVWKWENSRSFQETKNNYGFALTQVSNRALYSLKQHLTFEINFNSNGCPLLSFHRQYSVLKLLVEHISFFKKLFSKWKLTFEREDLDQRLDQKLPFGGVTD